MKLKDPGSVETGPLEGLFPVPDDPELRSTAEALVAATGRSVVAILLYGSRVQGSSPDRWSAYDFVVITDSYTRFYQGLSAGGYLWKPWWVISFLSHVLPPNVISFRSPFSDRPPAKCAVVGPRHLRRALGPKSPDHFLKGRVVQRLALVWTRGPDEERLVLSALRRAREGVVGWVRPFLPGPFDVELFAETMLRVSYRGEIRPESPERVFQVFQSQRETLLTISREALNAAVDRGYVFREAGQYRWRKTPGRVTRMAYTLYFTGSKVRATARWFKYIVTFEGWLDYILRKIERRAGFEVEVTEKERRWPLIFLWPKLFMVLRTVKRGGGPSASGENGEPA